MGKNRMIFYAIFGAYHLCAFIFTVVIDSNTSALFSMAGYVHWFKYISFIGVVLIITDFAWSWRLHHRHEKESDEFRHENNTLKAKIYDFQEGPKESSKQATPTGSK
jgi:hypothetical protein